MAMRLRGRPSAMSRSGARPQRGSVLVLVPAGFLALMALGAMAVDSAVVYQAHEQLHATLDAAAADAVAAGIGSEALYKAGAVEVQQAAAFVCTDVEAQAGGDLHDIRLWMATGPHAVRLEAAATVYAIFGRAIPGFGVRAVKAAGEAVVSSGAGSGPAPGRALGVGPLRRLDCQTSGARR